MGISQLIYYLKEEIKKKYILELSIHRINDDDRYPDKIKYSLIFTEIRTEKRVLMDNHHPKGHHLHLDDVELKYNYIDNDSLILDFKKYIFEHFGEKV